MSYRYILVQQENEVRTITLNNPDRRNSLNPTMQDELIDALEQVSYLSTRVLVLRGAGECFCAGLDLSMLRDLLEAGPVSHKEDASRIAKLFRTLYEVEVPSVALVHGPAIAGGLGLAILCDFTWAYPEARFGLTEARIGFVPAIVSAFLTLQIGEKRCRDLLLSARLINSAEAQRLGLVNEVVEPEGIDERITAAANQLMRNGPASMAKTKRLLALQNSKWLDFAISQAIEASVDSRMSSEFHEGVCSFLEKRTPGWTR